jgi:membrane protein
MLSGAGSVVRTAYRAFLAFLDHNGFEMSGYAAFTALLSLFPFLLFLTALAGFFGDEKIAEQVFAGALEFAPQEVVGVIRPVIYEVLTQRHGGLLTISILFALWSASSGVEALRTILNRSYGASETRPIWMLRPQSVIIVIVGAVLALLFASIIIVGPMLLHRALPVQPVNDRLWMLLRYGIAGSVVTGCVVILHLILPNCRLRLLQVATGTILTTLLWSAGAGLFSMFVDRFMRISVTYGSLGGIILTLLFFYLIAIIFAFGAEVNAQLQHLARPVAAPADTMAVSADRLLHRH